MWISDSGLVVGWKKHKGPVRGIWPFEIETGRRQWCCRCLEAGTCYEVRVKLQIRVWTVILLTRSIIFGIFEDLELRMSITDWLSHQRSIRSPDHWGPQTMQAR